MLQAPVPVTETGIGKAMLVVPEKEHSPVWRPPRGVLYSSLPVKCAEQSYTEDKAALSLPLTKEAGTTRHVVINLSNFTPVQLGSTPHCVHQYETDTDPESDSDADIYPSSSTPLTALQADPNGGRFMVSGSVSDQLDSETSTRETMASQRQLVIDLDAESDKQMTETEEILIEEGADTQPNNDVSAFISNFYNVHHRKMHA